MEVVNMLRVILWALALGLCAAVGVTSMKAGFPWIDLGDQLRKSA